MRDAGGPDGAADDVPDVLDGFGELRRAAARCSDLAASVAGAGEERRALDDALVRELVANGLLRTGVCRSVGGPQTPPSVMLEAAETVARGDASAGWCVAIAMTSSLLSAYLSAKGADEVFGDPRSTAVGVWAPTARARAVGGGVVVSGRWTFCSGVPHADWLFAGCMAADADADGAGSGPRPLVVAVPVAELEILDTWHTVGMRATGSHDCVAEEVFVPERRVVSVVDGPPAGAGALYRFPLLGFFAASVAAAALGNARGAVDDLRALATVKKPLGSARTLAERSRTQDTLARAEASLQAARLLFRQAVDDAWRAARDEAPVEDELRVRLRLAAAHAARTAADVTTAMYELGGTSAVYETSPLQRRFRDAHTRTAHVQIRQPMYEVTGRYLLGLPTETALL
ncbi:alkylation response protein AidB-like acyl-CoA dehydrogenase [Streptomyces sp. B3I7]|uniref:acyl-CoA dehydrogenase family protein n=1 Tax=Streptomyces sp. B3I7 TaxID=3042269 RepID=UPI002787FA9D|nr:acyl-CoA dehydrogenase family protein [Streptomyces sp. B3I7]MDQ0808623.1 alkylation response protein AidB-like acyl-CoA dehydrogenase [Streptomyces sp. B3I7]